MSTEIKYSSKKEIYKEGVCGGANLIFEFVLPSVALSTQSPTFGLITGPSINIKNLSIACDSTDFDLYILNRDITDLKTIYTIFESKSINGNLITEVNKTMIDYANEKYTYLIIDNNDGTNPTGLINLTLEISQV